MDTPTTGTPGWSEGRSVAEVARRLIEVGRAGGVIGPSRRALALALHELEPGLVADAGAGAWPAQGVARRIAVAVTLVPSTLVAAVPGEPGERRRYAWSVPGLAIGAPGVIEGRSVAEVARGLVEVGRAGGVIGPSRRALALVVHELEPELVVDVVAGAWPAQGVARRIAVSVTLVPSTSVAAMPGEPAAGPAP